MNSDEESTTATIVACRRCGRRFFCDPHGNCWCMAMTQAAGQDDESGDDCVCPDCAAERET